MVSGGANLSIAWGHPTKGKVSTGQYEYIPVDSTRVGFLDVIEDGVLDIVNRDAIWPKEKREYVGYEFHWAEGSRLESSSKL